MRHVSRWAAVSVMVAVAFAMTATPALAGDTATVTGQIDTQLVSVILSSCGDLDYGTAALSGDGTGQYVQVTNNGTLNADWSLVGHDAHDAAGDGVWTLAAERGVDQYGVDILDPKTKGVFALSTISQTWRTNEPPSESHDFYPVVHMPTSSSTNGVYVFEIEILATQSAVD
jgi:hypothetical protein